MVRSACRAPSAGEAPERRATAQPEASPTAFTAPALVPLMGALEVTAHREWPISTLSDWDASHGGDYRLMILTTNGPALSRVVRLALPD